MTKRTKMVTGVVALLPTFLCLVSAAIGHEFIVSQLKATKSGVAQQLSHPLLPSLLILLIFSQLISSGYFVSHLLKMDAATLHSRMPQLALRGKPYWAFVLVLGGSPGALVYWYWFIWREPRQLPS